MKKTYYITLVKTLYFEGTAIVQADSEQEAREIVTADNVDTWEATDEDCEIAEGDDAVTTDDE